MTDISESANKRPGAGVAARLRSLAGKAASPLISFAIVLAIWALVAALQILPETDLPGSVDGCHGIWRDGRQRAVPFGSFGFRSAALRPVS